MNARLRGKQNLKANEREKKKEISDILIGIKFKILALLGCNAAAIILALALVLALAQHMVYCYS